MFEIRTTANFDEWFRDFRHRQIKRRIQTRIDRLQVGNPGQHRTLLHGVCEMKLDATAYALAKQLES